MTRRLRVGAVLLGGAGLGVCLGLAPRLLASPMANIDSALYIAPGCEWSRLAASHAREHLPTLSVVPIGPVAEDEELGMYCAQAFDRGADGPARLLGLVMTDEQRCNWLVSSASDQLQMAADLEGVPAWRKDGRFIGTGFLNSHLQAMGLPRHPEAGGEP